MMFETHSAAVTGDKEFLESFMEPLRVADCWSDMVGSESRVWSSSLLPVEPHLVPSSWGVVVLLS